MTASGGLETKGSRTTLEQVKRNLVAWAGYLRRPRRIRGRVSGLYRLGPVTAGATITVVLLALLVVTTDAWSIDAALGAPHSVRRFFDVVTDFGKSGWILWPVGVVMLGLALISRPSLGRIGQGIVAAWTMRLTFLFAAVALPGLFTAIVKRLIGRARPLVEGSVDPYLYDPFAWKAAYASLPSGHTTTAFSAAVAIGALWPQSRPYIWIYALVIGVSRVAVTAHHPSDVLAGAVVGMVGALLVRDWFAARGLAFKVTAAGPIGRLPGPSWGRVKMVARRLAGA